MNFTCSGTESWLSLPIDYSYDSDHIFALASVPTQDSSQKVNLGKLRRIWHSDDLKLRSRSDDEDTASGSISDCAAAQGRCCEAGAEPEEASDRWKEGQLPPAQRGRTVKLSGAISVPELFFSRNQELVHEVAGTSGDLLRVCGIMEDRILANLAGRA